METHKLFLLEQITNHGNGNLISLDELSSKTYDVKLIEGNRHHYRWELNKTEIEKLLKKGDVYVALPKIQSKQQTGTR